MSKRAKIISIVVALLIVGLVLYFLFRKPKALPTVIAPEPVKGAPAVVETDQFPFDEGSRGDNVRRLQVALNRIKPSDKIIEDGVFGPTTRTKLLTTVSTYLSQRPISEAQLIEIIRIGNRS